LRIAFSKKKRGSGKPKWRGAGLDKWLKSEAPIPPPLTSDKLAATLARSWALSKQTREIVAISRALVGRR